MQRTKATRNKPPFEMRSGNSTSFKKMGSKSCPMTKSPYPILGGFRDFARRAALGPIGMLLGGRGGGGGGAPGAIGTIAQKIKSLRRCPGGGVDEGAPDLTPTPIAKNIKYKK